MALARCSRSSFSSLRSKWDGGKNTSACGPRHAAFICQASSTRCALTWHPPFGGDPTGGPLGETRVNRSRAMCCMIANTPRSEPCRRGACRLVHRCMAAGRAGQIPSMGSADQCRSRWSVAAPSSGSTSSRRPSIDTTRTGLGGVDRRGPVGAGPPRGVADGDDAVGGDPAHGGADLADHPLAPDRRASRSGCGPWPASRRSSPAPCRRWPPAG